MIDIYRELINLASAQQDDLDLPRAARAVAEFYHDRRIPFQPIVEVADSPLAAHLSSALITPLLGIPSQQLSIGLRQPRYFGDALRTFEGMRGVVSRATLEQARLATGEEFRAYCRAVWEPLLTQLGPSYRFKWRKLVACWCRHLDKPVGHTVPLPQLEDDDIYYSYHQPVTHPTRQRRGEKAFGAARHWSRQSPPSTPMPTPSEWTPSRPLQFSGLGCADPGRLAYKGAHVPTDWPRSALELARAGVWDCIMQDRCVILVRRPIRLCADDRGRPHSDSGPALAWRDGFCVYALNQVIVADWVIKQPGRLTRQTIEAEDNAEVRRVLVERFGRERFLQESQYQTLDQDRDGGGKPRRLLQLEAGRQLSLAYVEVTCPSTERVYLLQVPTTMRTCREAVAWTFGLNPQDYAPLAEA